jgi:hypothetical protein
LLSSAFRDLTNHVYGLSNHHMKLMTHFGTPQVGLDMHNQQFLMSPGCLQLMKIRPTESTHKTQREGRENKSGRRHIVLTYPTIDVVSEAVALESLEAVASETCCHAGMATIVQFTWGEQRHNPGTHHSRSGTPRKSTNDME